MRLAPVIFRRTAALAALAAVAGTAGPAAAAVVEPPRTIAPGCGIPIDFPGYREPADDRLPANHRIVSVAVELARGERHTITMSAPRGFRIVTFGFAEHGQVGGFITSGTAKYIGKRTTQVTLVAFDRMIDPGGTGTGTIYMLARRASQG